MLAMLKRRIEELERMVKRNKIIQTAKIRVSETTNGTILDVSIGNKQINNTTNSSTGTSVPRWL